MRAPTPIEQITGGLQTGWESVRDHPAIRVLLAALGSSREEQDRRFTDPQWTPDVMGGMPLPPWGGVTVGPQTELITNIRSLRGDHYGIKQVPGNKEIPLDQSWRFSGLEREPFLPDIDVLPGPRSLPARPSVKGLLRAAGDGR